MAAEDSLRNKVRKFLERRAGGRAGGEGERWAGRARACDPWSRRRRVFVYVCAWMKGRGEGAPPLPFWREESGARLATARTAVASSAASLPPRGESAGSLLPVCDVSNWTDVTQADLRHVQRSRLKINSS